MWVAGSGGCLVLLSQPVSQSAGGPGGVRGRARERDHCVDHQTPPAPAPPLLFCCLAVSDVWLAGRFLNGPWNWVTPFPCCRH